MVFIPDKEWWSLEFDNTKWEEVALQEEPDRQNAPPGAVQLHMDLFNPIFGNALGPEPPLDQLVSKQETIVEQA